MRSCRAADGILAGPISQRADDPAPENNRRHDTLLPGPHPQRGERRRAVLVLPQWNADEEGHVGLCRLLARFGMSALRLSLPYHDTRMPPELTRADYIVSANIVRTLEVCRQAVLDARRAIAWLAARATTASASSAQASGRACRCSRRATSRSSGRRR